MLIPGFRHFFFWVMLFAVSGIVQNLSVAGAEVIRIGGTGSGLGMIRLLSDAFVKKHPGTYVKVLSSIGSSGAIKAVSQGTLDIGFISRGLKSEELRLGLRVVECATTPFVLVAGNKVDVGGLSHKELVRIIRGEKRTWPNGERIRVVLRPAADADTIIARGISPEMNAAMDAALTREGMIMALTNQEAVEIMEKTPGSLGFCTLAQIISENRSLRILSYEGVKPSLTSLSNGTYPLALKFSFATRQDLSAAGKSFIEFACSREGRKILEKSGSMPGRFRGKP